MAYFDPTLSYAAGGMDRETGQNMPAANWQRLMDTIAFLGGTDGSGAHRKIAETVVSGASVASVDFTSIPATFRHLLLECYVRSAVVATSTTLLARFNNDSGANYDYQYLNGGAAVASAAEAFGQTSQLLGSVPGASAGANLFGAAVIQVPHYANAANNKISLTRNTYKIGTASGNMAITDLGGHWRSNAAINRVTVLLTSGNIEIGSVVTLYGI